MRITFGSFAVSMAVFAALLTLPAGASADVDAKRYIGSYHSEAGCREAGREGVRKRRWSNPTCVKSILDISTWDLWVD
ncbi:hypothetical protein [Nonomuraea sp. LPB2021202275-12-8]|uniref:hypothetical protein n=1 Tax=Nonomuraea sp. LPB2021202275-12-8 TaxID=3120159 RepID=UPI00300D9C9D